MIVTRKLDGGSEGKGRNSYIRIAEMEGSIDYAVGGRLRLEVFSKVRGESAPIILILDQADARTLAGILADYLSERIK